MSIQSPRRFIYDRYIQLHGFHWECILLQDPVVCVWRYKKVYIRRYRIIPHFQFALKQYLLHLLTQGNKFYLPLSSTMLSYLPIVTALLAVGPAVAHMELNSPYPLRSQFDPANDYTVIDYSMTSPLLADGVYPVPFSIYPFDIIQVQTSLAKAIRLMTSVQPQPTPLGIPMASLLPDLLLIMGVHASYPLATTMALPSRSSSQCWVVAH